MNKRYQTTSYELTDPGAMLVPTPFWTKTQDYLIALFVYELTLRHGS
jgi:hypothetical protein